MNRYQKEYIFRINKVIDYIEKNLDKTLFLEELARVANFSPYHFHRIFSAFTGETLNNFVKRKKIERAGSMLLDYPDIPVSEVAMACGYSSMSVFCRNFKAHFNMNAGEFREKWDVEERKIRQLKSKNSQLESKKEQRFDSGSDYVCDIESLKTEVQIMETKFEIKEMPELKLVYCRHQGAFHLIGQAYEKLFKWAEPRGLLNNEDLKTVTVYHDDPKVTDPEKVQQSACILVDEPIKTEGEFGYMTVPGGKYVVGNFEILPTEFEQAWDQVCVWLSESGYQPADGYPYELYHQECTEHPEGKFILNICVPVKPL